MAAGGPGDHPLSDVLDYDLSIFGPECDELIREISKYTTRAEMLEIFDWFSKDQLENPSKFACELKTVLEKLIQDRKERGWQI